MERAGRNDPCPCGSGRKYKRCCLAHEAERLAFAAVLESTALPLLSRLARFAERAAGAPLERIAREEFPFWRGSLTKPQGARVVDFLMFDCRPSQLKGRPMQYARRTIEEFAIEAGPALPDESRTMLGHWVDAPRRLYRAENWSGGFTACVDLFAENAGPISIFDIDGSWKPTAREPVALRALTAGGGFFCAGRPLGFDGRSAADVVDSLRRRHLDFVRTQRIVGLDDFLRLAPKAIDEEGARQREATTIILPGA